MMILLIDIDCFYYCQTFNKVTMIVDIVDSIKHTALKQVASRVLSGFQFN